jgi:hypothetical protein
MEGRGMKIRILALATAAALSLAAPASARVIYDPDEAVAPADLDIEWAGSSRTFTPGVGWEYTHTIKTRAPYSRRPCVHLRMPGEMPYLNFTCGGPLDGQPVRIHQSPKLLPDTISYTFNATAIGSPAEYHWTVTIGNPNVDHVPDAGYVEVELGPTLSEPGYAYTWGP